MAIKTPGKRSARHINGAGIDSAVTLRVLAAVRRGDFSARMPTDWSGSAGKVAAALNTIIESNQRLEREIRRLSRNFGKEGQFRRGSMAHAGGAWDSTLDAVSDLVEDLASPNTEIARVISAVANGDLSQTMPLEIDGRPLQGQFLNTAKTVNTMVGQLNGFASEVTRVAREVGTEGRLGGQAEVKGVGGVWKELTDNVNFMAGNLTSQVRNIAEVTTAVQQGDLSKKITVDVRGEILELKNTINTMVDQLNAFAKEVTRVAREVGTDGKLGGQANVEGVAGTWKDPTDNVNTMASNLTDQVRGIARVVTAVANGDLNGKLTLEAKGEIAELADTINSMTDTLAVFAEQVTTVAREVGAEGRLGGQAHVPGAAGTWRDLTDNVNQLSATLTTQVRAIAEVATAVTKGDLTRSIRVDASGEVANLKDYIKISSALGESTPANIVVLPVLFEGDVRAVIELASFQPFSLTHLDFLDQLAESIGIVLNTIEANSRTEDLLKQSQSLATELQSQQDQLQRTNEDLAGKARQLAEQNAEVEQRRLEVESAKALVEEKAEQLALTSRYKSEFLANMSHELRTPLNSLLILAQELAANPDGNLMAKQIEYATIIRSSGTDLLKLITDILDLSKIESGTVALDISPWPVAELRPMLERTFRHVAEATRLAFAIELRTGLPETIPTDPQRLQQILNNLLSNAFKFTEKGKVEFVAEMATSGWSPSNETLNRASNVVAFRVIDSGIGISFEKQQSIFESFAQADGSTSRKYGGTGLGLSICRELTRLLGGEIRVQSEPGVGSIFSVYLPLIGPGHRRPAPADEGHAAEKSPRPVLVGAGSNGMERETVAAASPSGAPVPTKSLLVVEDDPVQRQYITDLMAPTNTRTIAGSNGDAALALLTQERFDCVVLDLGLPGLSGWRVIEELQTNKALGETPLLVYTARDLTRKEEVRLGKAAKSIVMKDARSPERLKHEIMAILQGAETDVEPALESGSNGAEAMSAALAGKKVLVVDDDIRNIFALTALLERQRMDVVSVDSGQEALDLLTGNSDIDIALVDVMMPEMDGYVTMSKMRELRAFADRPIIALTAKAMKGDREKCIEAGASDYIAKPINNAHLLSMLKSWLVQ